MNDIKLYHYAVHRGISGYRIKFTVPRSRWTAFWLDLVKAGTQDFPGSKPRWIK